MPTEQSPSVAGSARSGGITSAERYLQKLCDKTFLSLWSYPRVFRDQRIHGGRTEGKEVCDLLVVFENHVLIFSDKQCSFPRSGNLFQDWTRWCRQAVMKSARQVLGAERWIRFYPDRLFIDRNCTVPFPYPLPPPASAIFHRIVVTHGASSRCREELGGSGSFMIMPSVIGEDHLVPGRGASLPFAIGQLSPRCGFIHVLDDTSLDIVLQTRDTIADLTDYLTKKERFITSGRLVAAAGEEELLAYYLGHLNEGGEHDFVIPQGIGAMSIDEGLWERFKAHPQRKAQIEANQISYVWDGIIEKFAHNLRMGTFDKSSHPAFADQERLVRWLAREDRTCRRALSEKLHELIWRTPRGEFGRRILTPFRDGDPYYFFLIAPPAATETVREYRDKRYELLRMYCLAVKYRYPDAKHIIGFATETEPVKQRSEDLLYLDATRWGSELQSEAEEIIKEFGLLRNTARTAFRVDEYPVVANKMALRTSGKRKGSRRNEPCPCGSGKKFKRCCGSSVTPSAE